MMSNFVISINKYLDLNILSYIKRNSLITFNIYLINETNNLNKYMNYCNFIYKYYNESWGKNYKNVNIYNYNKIDSEWMKNLKIINFSNKKIDNSEYVKIDKLDNIEINDNNLCFINNYDEKFERIYWGGTFNFLHFGHKLLLNAGVEWTNNLEIFVKSDKLLNKKSNKHLIESNDFRKSKINSYLKYYKDLNYQINLFKGPIGHIKENNASLLLTEESINGGHYVNKVRKEKGFKEMNLIVMKNLNISKNNKISSSHFREKIQLKESEYNFLKNKFLDSVIFFNKNYDNFSAQDWFNIILLKYSETHRYYHNLTHIIDCLEKIELFEITDKEKYTIILILFFHDIIYNTEDPKDNEYLSSIIFKEFCINLKLFSTEEIEYYSQIIINTKNHLNRSDEGLINNIVLDIDFSILSGDYENYWKYIDKIKNEYNIIPINTFNKNRKKFLLKILNHKNIFRFNNIFNNQKALDNINKELLNY